MMILMLAVCQCHVWVTNIIVILLKVWRRPSVGHADPLGGDYPLITKEGHNVLDVIFTSPIASLGNMCRHTVISHL